MNKTFLSFILFVAVLCGFHYVVFPIMDIKEFSWVMNRYVYYILLCLTVIVINIGLRLKPPVSLIAMMVWVLGYYFYDAVLYPPIPWTLFITYMVMWSIGTFLYVSQDAKTFRDFRAPIVKTIIGEYKLARIVVFALLPVLVGWMTYNQIYPSFQEPVELRTVHPAPPATTKVHGKTWTLETARNPYRVDEQDNYKNSFPFLDAEKNEYMKNITEGGSLFFQNCHYCHGDQLNGNGMFSHVFNPTPANFIDPGTIAMLRESFIFWRVSKGGPGLPNESTPWSSAMPPWEEHLTTEEMWKIILFEYWYTGWHPRTFDTEESYVGQWEKEGKPAGVH